MHSVIVQKRRKRSINFTESDRQVLINLVQPHLSVIENKRMDKFTSKLKSETWENIKTQYNQLNTEPRTALQLKLFYEANKYRMRRMNKTTTDANQSDEKIDGKIVKIELERKTILDALAQTETEQGQSDDSEVRSPKAKIKCVDIEKLQETKQLETSDRAKAQEVGKSSSLKVPLSKDADTDFAGFNLRPPFNSTTLQASLMSTVQSPDSALTKQDELHAMRMKILEDERLFRRQEHLKHMEYFEIGIMALKAFLLKQAQSTPLVTNQK